MPRTKNILEQNSSLQESENRKIQVARGGRIEGAEGGLRADIFDHDENSEYDFSEDDCSLCELPEHAQNHIIEDMEYEEGNA